MFDKTYYATHPDMMECVSNEELRDRYLIGGLFRDGECVLNYTHAERFVIGGVVMERPGRLAAEHHLVDAAVREQFVKNLQAMHLGCKNFFHCAGRFCEQWTVVHHTCRMNHQLDRAEALASLLNGSLHVHFVADLGHGDLEA